MPIETNLTDEQLLNALAPVVKPEDRGKEAPPPQEPTPEEEPVLEAVQNQDDPQNTGGEGQGSGEGNPPGSESTETNKGEDGKNPPADGKVVATDDQIVNDKTSKTEGKAEGEGNPVKDKPNPDEATPQNKKDNASGTAGDAKDQVIDYKAAYEEIMKPFNANGKEISLKDPKEVVQLMQMGANYTRKMQELAPHRKHITMMQANNLDANDLSLLIDLKSKNVEALKKLIKDYEIDVDKLDLESVTYQQGNHIVSDEVVSFSTVVNDIASTPKGRETIQLMTGWDQASKDALWKDPGIVQAIHAQRESGVYDLISTELERRKMLGQIPENTPYLAAYKAVGDEMAEASRAAAEAVKAANPVAQRTATPKPQVTNSAKADAATATRTTGKAKAVPTNVLAMSDEDFMKSDILAGKV